MTTDGQTPFTRFATSVLDARFAADPVEATEAGEHRFDHLLEDPSEEAAHARADTLRQQLDELDDLAPDSVDEGVDAAVLRTTLQADLFALGTLGEATWNPMLHNPGTAIQQLTSREFAPARERYLSVAARLALVESYLAAARGRLGAVSGIHTQTAIAQLDGTAALIESIAPDLARYVDDSEPLVARAVAAVREHAEWLRGRLAGASHDPRIGPELFAAKLALTLDTAFAPDDLLARAEDDLARVTAEITAEAGRFAGVARPDADTVRAVLAELGTEAPTDAEILPMCRDAMAACTEFVRDHDLITVFDDPVDVIEMPEIDRGVAVAFCRPPGPLEPVPLPTEFAVSPPPSDWSAERIASFYREYNAHMLQNLTVHEAMPGHALQLMHSRRHQAATPVRAVFWSGSFVEGWAVYTEELMALRGYRRDVSERAASALRMQQLKMQLRTIINAILDIRFHCHDLDESAAMTLMTTLGFQEDGEAAGKWRRVQLSSTQLSTYYVGYSEIRDLAEELRAARPGASDREIHDAMLAHGSPAARHVRTLLMA